MSIENSNFDVPKFIDSKRMGVAQSVTILLCALIMFLDGLDTQAISYMAPHIAKEWGLSKEMLGPVFSSALAGLMLGYLFFSPLSDKYGHRRIALSSTIVFGLLTLVTTLANSVESLIALRFLTGIALGAVVPSAIALTTEYSPKRLRATFVLIIYSGFSLGFVAAGALAANLIPVYGWRSLLWVGAIAPLALAFVVVLYLPESIEYLVRRNADPKTIWAMLRKMDKNLGPDIPANFIISKAEKGNAVKSLFRPGMAVGTVLLWVAFILNLGQFYALQSWMPTILTGLGYKLGTVALATSLTTVGGIVAAFVIGPAMDRLGAYTSLATVYVVGVGFAIMLGYSIHAPDWVLLTACFFAGFCISGGQKSIIALAAIYYPTFLRSTGVGWALGIGRLGGIGGPLLVGSMMHMGFKPEETFSMFAIPMLLSAVIVAVMGRFFSKQVSDV